MVTNKRNYWNNKHEELCTKYVKSKHNSKEQCIIYKKLSPAVYTLCENVTNRFFTISYSNKINLLQEICIEVFLNLNKFKPEFGTKYYSYISNLCKNHIYDKIKSPYSIITVKDVPVRLQEEEETVVEDYSEIDDISNEENNNNRCNLILSYLQQLLIEIEDRKNKEKIRGVIILCIDYINEYNNFNLCDLNDYILNNCEIVPATIYNLIKQIFKGYGSKGVINSRFRDIFKDRFGILNDDYCPNDNHINKRGNIVKRHEIDINHIMF